MAASKANKRSRAAKPLKELTAVELEMMNVIWRIGPCSVAQVQDSLRPQRELAYTSVSTVVRILEQKGYVTSEKQGRGHLYHAAVSKQSYQASSLTRIVHHVFDGAPSLLVQRLLDSEALAPDELAQIEQLLREKAKG
ncbi:MAG TPA: BlaI/MecI/CopY family transcriptional regulator [Polyangiaceae bacterium]|nr:BlaI/MecI/CopY family transcriptional regulator [Polyangiaceae bacterium]